MGVRVNRLTITQTLWSFLLSSLGFATLLPCLAFGQTANIAGKWDLQGSIYTVRQDGTKAYGFTSKNRRVFEGSISGSTWHGRTLVGGVSNANGRCPKGEKDHWVPFQLTLSTDGTQLNGKWRANVFTWSLTGRINCHISDYKWIEATGFRAAQSPAPQDRTTEPRRRDTTTLVTRPEGFEGVSEGESDNSTPARSCVQCGNALISALSSKIDVLPPTEVRQFLLGSRTRYAQCIQGVPDGCEHTTVYWKDKRALATCYDSDFEGDPLKACILRAIY